VFDYKKVEEIIREDISKRRQLGEHAGGSGHLAYRSITEFKLVNPKETNYKGKEAYEIVCNYDIYTETEFLHAPEDDELYTEHYTEVFIISKENEILSHS